MIGDITRTTKTWRDGHLVRHEINGISQRITDEPAPMSGLLFPKSATIQPFPRDQWPPWAKALKQFAVPQDEGIGAIIARIIGDETSLKFKAWYKATFGKSCGCTGRQTRWNQQYPLP